MAKLQRSSRHTHVQNKSGSGKLTVFSASVKKPKQGKFVQMKPMQIKGHQPLHQVFYSEHRVRKKSIVRLDQVEVDQAQMQKFENKQKGPMKVKEQVESFVAEQGTIDSDEMDKQQLDSGAASNDTDGRSYFSIFGHKMISWKPRPATSKAATPRDLLHEEVIMPEADQQAQQRSRRACQCPKSSSHPMFCTRALSWFQRSHQQFHLDMDTNYAKLKAEYEEFASRSPDADSMSQIERDLGRTFPLIPYYSQEKGGQGHKKLRRVLIAFSNYRTDICYVQGMNFIVGQLLLHCSESFAFWLFVALIEDWDLKEVYGPQLRGLFMHSAIINMLVQANLPNLSLRLGHASLRASVYASEWIIGMFASVIPSKHMVTFFDNFFENGWLFFYQLVLTMLKQHQTLIETEEDMYNLLRRIKQQAHDSPTTAINEQQSTSQERAIAIKKQKTAEATSEKPSSWVFFWTAKPEPVVQIGEAAYWPDLMARSKSEWPQLVQQKAGIEAVARSFDVDSNKFKIEIPSDSAALNEFLISERQFINF